MIGSRAHGRGIQVFVARLNYPESEKRRGARALRECDVNKMACSGAWVFHHNNGAQKAEVMFVFKLKWRATAWLAIPWLAELHVTSG
jgi:hypothetical protein